MTLETINIGAAPNDKTGDSLRDAYKKTNAAIEQVNANTEEIAKKVGDAPSDGKQYARENGKWSEVAPPSSGAAWGGIAGNLSDQEDLAVALDGKVGKVPGKTLSSNDFTNAERVKLANISEEATKNMADSELLSRKNHTGCQLLETIADAGTAAREDIQSDALDKSSGAVLKVGSFGIGGALDLRNGSAYTLKASSPPSGWISSGTVSGFALCGELGISALPPETHGVVTISSHWHDYSANWGVQQKFESSGRIFYRYAVNSNTWSSWVDVARKEEGKWNPVIWGSVTPGNAEYTRRYGSYWVNGNLCTARCSLVMSSVGGATGGVLIGGFPFVSLAHNGTSDGAAVSDIRGMINGQYSSFAVMMQSGAGYATLRGVLAVNAVSYNVGFNEITDKLAVEFSLTYVIA